MTNVKRIDGSTSWITPKSTGYAATAAMILSGTRAVSKNKFVQKYHKPISYVALTLTALHIAVVEFYHHKYKKM